MAREVDRRRLREMASAAAARDGIGAGSESDRSWAPGRRAGGAGDGVVGAA